MSEVGPLTPVHAAALAVATESFGMLRGALDGLPDEAMGWMPAPDTNSLAVLTAHCISSSRFWLANGSGNPTSISRYRATERAASFATNAEGTRQLAARIDAFMPELHRILGMGTEEALRAEVSWSDEDPAERVRTGAQCLVHAIGHLREHVGQALLMRDLWLAR